MDDILKDERFRHVLSDPRFRRVPKSEKKVKIDRRFEAMFTDDKFKLEYAVDKRGRRVNQTQSDNLKKYYDLPSSVEEESEPEGENDDSSENYSSIEPKLVLVPVESEKSEVIERSFVFPSTSTGNSSAGLRKNDDVKVEAKSVDSFRKGMMKDAVVERLKDLSVDYARGIGTLESDESSSDESTSEDSEDEVVHPWGELDKDADITEEATTRLAACNLDWDRINAKDLFILFSSFLPVEGFIKSVTIYPSEYGLERIKEEEAKGPKELLDNCKFQEFADEDFRDKHSEGSEYCMEKLREYQLNRLKYYYAVITFDTLATANKIYAECDGIEYESSATKVDLRFIPDDMEFNQEPKDMCTSMPDVNKYKPRLFVNSALQLGKVNLTWDETDPDRVEFTKKLAGGGNITIDDLQAYIAATSDGESGKDNLSEDENEANEDEVKSELEGDPIAKYKALLSSVASDQKKHKSNVDMEISWGVGLSNEDSDSDIGHKSDTEYSVAKKEMDVKKGKLEKNMKKSGLEESQDHLGEIEELELLLVDDHIQEETKSHFNFKDIQTQEKRQKKKTKRKFLVEKPEENKFEINVNDPRFSALYTSHHFNIDPADPHFVRTEAAEKILREKQKRRKLNREGKQGEGSTAKHKMNPELAGLVKSIKVKQSAG